MTGDIPEDDGRIQAIREREWNRCQNCDRPKGQVVELVPHQIVPQERGGTSRLSNYALLCQRCYRLANEGDLGEVA